MSSPASHAFYCAKDDSQCGCKVISTPLSAHKTVKAAADEKSRWADDQ